MDIGINHFRGKKGFITGHTCFKGTWLCRVLLASSAKNTGYWLLLSRENVLYSLAGIERHIHAIYQDIRNYELLEKAITTARPDYIFHLAAQALVVDGYKFPRATYEMNVMGTVSLLEGIRNNINHSCLVVNITTDKAYQNKEWVCGYQENGSLDGCDPHSNSKSCSELVTNCYRNLYTNKPGTFVSTARAGNVIGGGDFAPNRSIPDYFRAITEGRPVQVRNPHSIRPYQHVLDPLFAYLAIAYKQTTSPTLCDCYNIGPDEQSCVTTEALVKEFQKQWGEEFSWEAGPQSGTAFHEANLLKPDCSTIKSKLGWHPVLKSKNRLQ